MFKLLSTCFNCYLHVLSVIYMFTLLSTCLNCYLYVLIADLLFVFPHPAVVHERPVKWAPRFEASRIGSTFCTGVIKRRRAMSCPQRVVLYFGCCELKEKSICTIQRKG